ncbi:hypothetical protein ASF53_10980 [Methylobacterium sp. Leaf123]|uniref:hypothetical protein n=1 Tax=Methylobacterium sp. Leaf123 TaxID=1736264 RepID=UPI0006FB3F70|nr:hypothetical protein [Methylobacterium sp. Leaf123]KQQ14326.1 hypothetical protein ASF53_10980 [Methylobacterium sp. Leaf123]
MNTRPQRLCREPRARHEAWINRRSPATAKAILSAREKSARRNSDTYVPAQNDNQAKRAD